MTPTKRFVSLLLAAACAATATTAAPAAPAKERKEFARCIDASNGADPAMLDCIAAEYKRQDKRLNAAYKKLLDSLTPARRKELVEVQRLWLKYTEANCAFYGDPEGGTSASLAANECAVTAREKRADELESLMPQ